MRHAALSTSIKRCGAESCYNGDGLTVEMEASMTAAANDNVSAPIIKGAEAAPPNIGTASAVLPANARPYSTEAMVIWIPVFCEMRVP